MNKLKKYFIIVLVFTILISLIGCSMGNTPTKKVEKFLDNYNRNDEVVTEQLKEMLNSDNLMSEEQKNVYRDLIQKQYKDMTYVIKDEKIEGNKATVTAEIEVYDYYKANKEAEDYYNNNRNEFVDNTAPTVETVDENSNTENVKEGVENAAENVQEGVENATDSISKEAKYINYRLDRIKNMKDRVKYTIDFNLTKEDGNWTVDDIDDITRQKIHGLYEH